MKDTILIRLMKQLPDGSFEVVGYEKHEKGKIFHSKYYKDTIERDCTGYPCSSKQILGLDDETCEGCDKTHNPQWNDILDADCSFNYGRVGHRPNYIPYDRKDQYTGIEVKKKKLFERDIVDRQIYKRFVGNGVESNAIIFSGGSFWIQGSDGSYSIADNIAQIKITGIEGVNK